MKSQQQNLFIHPSSLGAQSLSAQLQPQAKSSCIDSTSTNVETQPTGPQSIASNSPLHLNQGHMGTYSPEKNPQNSQLDQRIDESNFQGSKTHQNNASFPNETGSREGEGASESEEDGSMGENRNSEDDSQNDQQFKAENIDFNNPNLYNQEIPLFKLKGVNWTVEKDRQLLEYVVRFKKDWKKISKKLIGRKVSPMTLKDRYKMLTQNNCITRQRRFSHLEDLKIVKYFKIHEFDWDKIASKFQDRTQVMLKNRYYSYIKKHDLIDKYSDAVRKIEQLSKDIEDYENDDEIIKFEKEQLNFVPGYNHEDKQQSAKSSNSKEDCGLQVEESRPQRQPSNNIEEPRENSFVPMNLPQNNFAAQYQQYAQQNHSPVQQQNQNHDVLRESMRDFQRFIQQSQNVMQQGQNYVQQKSSPPQRQIENAQQSPNYYQNMLSMMLNSQGMNPNSFFLNKMQQNNNFNNGGSPQNNNNYQKQIILQNLFSNMDKKPMQQQQQQSNMNNQGQQAFPGSQFGFGASSQSALQDAFAKYSASNNINRNHFFMNNNNSAGGCNNQNNFALQNNNNNMSHQNFFGQPNNNSNLEVQKFVQKFFQSNP